MFCTSWLSLLLFVSFYLLYSLIVVAYETNVFSPYRWTTRTIQYAFDDEKYDPETLTKLRTIHKNVLNKFKKEVGPILSWKEIPYADTFNMSRYLIFGLDSVGCGYAEPAQYGIPTVIVLSNETGCDLYTNMAHFLTAFGMLSPHLRKDRDDYVLIHYDNIQPMDHQIHATCLNCMTSDNEIFKDYDCSSILHSPKYSLYAINPELPVITEKNDTISLLPDSYNYTGRKFSPTDIKIFRFIFYGFEI